MTSEDGSESEHNNEAGVLLYGSLHVASLRGPVG